MSRNKINAARFLLGAMICLSWSPVFADLVDDATFLLPNSNYSSYTFPSARTVANGYALTSQYISGNDADGNEVWIREETGSVFTNSSGSLSLTQDANNYSILSANPTTLGVKSFSVATTDGSENYHIWGQAQAWDVCPDGRNRYGRTGRRCRYSG